MKMSWIGAVAIACAAWTTIVAQERLEGQYGFAQFAADSAHTMVEFYYELPSARLSFHAVDAAHNGASVMCSLTASRMGVTSAEEHWHVGSLRSTSDIGGRNLLGVHRLELTPGEYVIGVVVRDSAAPLRVDSFSLRLPVHSYKSIRPMLSSVQLGKTMRYVSPAESSSFVKGGVEITPNVGAVYSDASLSLVYYVEAYNLQVLSITDSLRMETDIINREGTVVYTHMATKPHSVPAIAIAESLAIDALPSGRYLLVLRAISDHGPGRRADTSQSHCEFTVNNSALPAFADPLEAPDVESSEFAGKSEGELDTLFLQFSPTATTQEREAFGRLSGSAAKADFLFRFWDARSKQNSQQTLREYHAALEYVVKTFTAMGRPGWRTDRGRVYLQYGAPSRPPEKHLFDVDSKPYEIWSYDIEGGVIFVFVDVSGFGEFRLVHSTERFEIHDESWKDHYAKSLMKGQ